MSQWLAPLAVLGCACCFIVCDTLAATWGKNGNIKALVVVIICSPAGYLIFGYLNKKYQLSLVAGWVNVAIAIGTVLVGWLLFNEELTARHWVGLGLAFTSIVVLMTGR